MLSCAGPALAGRALFGTGIRYSLSSVFEPHFIFNLTDYDRTLVDYHYQPINRIFMPLWGLQGRFYEENGFTFGLGTLFGTMTCRSVERDKTTNVTIIKTGAQIGYTTPFNSSFVVAVGFASLAASLSSDIDGGALLYLGPYIQPEASFFLHLSRFFLEIGLGYYLHLPIGPAHEMPLWEDTFHQPVFHGLAVSVAMGFANQSPNTGGR
jgi:hypothetical protein